MCIINCIIGRIIIILDILIPSDDIVPLYHQSLFIILENVNKTPCISSARCVTRTLTYVLYTSETRPDADHNKGPHNL